MRKRTLHLGFEIDHAGAVAAEVREFASVWSAAAWALKGERRYYARVETRRETRAADTLNAARAPQLVIGSEPERGGAAGDRQTTDVNPNPLAARV